MLINSGVEEGRRALEGMKNGTFKGLSLGANNVLDKESLRIKHIGALEVSIATEGARPGTNIYWFQDESHKPIYSQFYKTKKMADELTLEEEQLKKKLEEIQQKKAAAQAGATLTAEEFLAKYGPTVAKLERLARGDVDALATTLEQQEEIARQNLAQEREAKRMRVNEAIEGAVQSGAIGGDPEVIKAEADRILDVAPTLISSFADARSNFTRVQSELLEERKQREAAQQELASAKDKLTKQQTIAMVAPTERYVPKPPTQAPVTAGVAPVQTNQPTGAVYRPQTGAGVVPVARPDSIFDQSRMYPAGPPLYQQPGYKPLSQQPVVQQQVTDQAIQQTAGWLASTPLPDASDMAKLYAGNVPFNTGRG
jgi:phage head maturation protease